MKTTSHCTTCKYGIFTSVFNEHDWRNINTSVLRQIKNTLNSEGYWYGDYETWDAIVAVCNLETMITFGVDIDEKWQVRKANGVVYEIGLKEVISYLRSKIIKQGSKYFFGEDHWDLFRLVLVIKKMNLETFFPEYNNLQKYCLQLCEDSSLMDLNDQWSGPAVLALALELCILCKKTKLKDNIYNSIVSLRNDDGSWGNSKDDALCIWHTSQVLNVVTLEQEELEKSLNSIIVHLQSDIFKRDPYLKDYYTSYAIWTLYKNGYINNDAFVEAYSDIKDRLSKGLIKDRGSLSMIGTILSRIFTNSGRIIDVIIKEDELQAYIEENKKLTKENEHLRKKLEKFSDGGFVVSKTAVKVIAWLGGVILAAIITTLITIWVTQLLGGQ